MSKKLAHAQIVGVAHYSENKTFMFCPDEAFPNQVEKFHLCGVGQMMSDGTFDFVAKPRIRSRSTLLKKLPHGRLSHTQDGAMMLTLKVFDTERLSFVEIKKTMLAEAKQAFS